MSRRRHLPRLRLFLPGLITTVILTAGSWDAPFLRPLRTELTYGWWVVVLYPLAALLALTQVVLWIGWIVARLHRAHHARRALPPAETAR